MLEDPKTKLFYDTDGVQTVFPINIPFDDEEEIHAWIRNKTTRLQDKLVNPDDFFLEGKNLITTAVWADGYLLVIKRIVSIRQLLQLLYGGPMPSEAIEKALDYLTKVALQHEEKFSRSLLLPETIDIEDLELQDPEEGFYLRYLSGALTWVQAFSGNQTLQPFMKVFLESLTAAIARSNIGAAGSIPELSDTEISGPENLDLIQRSGGKWKDRSLTEIFGAKGDSNPWRHDKTIETVGKIVMCPKETAPPGWLECNGKTLGKTGSGADYTGDEYKNLYDYLSDDFGGTDNWDNGDTINLPKISGIFPRGWDHGEGNDPDAASRTDRGDGTTGDHVGTKQTDQYAQHYHTYPDRHLYQVYTNKTSGAFGTTTIPDSGWSGARGTAGYSGDWCYIQFQHHDEERNSNNAGGSETRPKNIYMMFIIKC